ncbi:MAG: DNA-processing protein DprA, partial [Saprospiraceae bacterium]
MHNDELLYAVALTKIEKVGAVTAKNLISYCGSPQAVLKEKKQHLLRIPQIGEGIAQAIQDPTIFSKAEEELRFTEQEQIQVIYYQDTLYPTRLKNYQDSPLILYYKGTSDLNQEKIIAVVGTRKVTEYGRRLIQQLIEGIRDLNILVVSGLAYGVDSLAHKKCVEEHIETVGILGHGLDRMYP